MIKIYLGNKTIFLVDKGNVSVANTVIVKSGEMLEQAFGRFECTADAEIFFASDSETELYKWFCQMFTVVPAAGGLVRSGEYFVFIYRRGVWDLPKGKIDEGESVEHAAVREVEEECGVENIDLVSALETTHHIYEYKGKKILKPTYWFLMQAEMCELRPQMEEDIEKAEWRTIHEFSDIYGNTFPSIGDVLKSFLMQDH